MSEKTPRTLAQRKGCRTVESPPGIFRTAVVWNEQVMLCHFRMTKGSKVPLHSHPAVQIGYAISGKVRFQREAGEAFTAVAGTGYCFGGGEKHGAEVLEDSELIECFAPMRPEYAED